MHRKVLICARPDQTRLRIQQWITYQIRDCHLCFGVSVGATQIQSYGALTRVANCELLIFVSLMIVVFSDLCPGPLVPFWLGEGELTQSTPSIIRDAL